MNPMVFKFKLKPQNVRKWRKAVIGVFGFLAYKAFFLFLVLFIIDLLLGVLVFHRYTFFPQETIEEQRDILKLNKELLRQSLRQIQENQQRFDNADAKTYDNLFR